MDARLDLEKAIAALEAQRTTLGDAVVDVSVAALREKLAALLRLREPEPRAPDPHVAAERKLVTVILADVQGSTDLAERLSVEAWVTLMDHLLQLLQAEIYRYGGQVNQFRGDGLVAFFGASRSHEDDPERAILAALAMQEAIAACAGELADRAGSPLRLRVGVNTGEVIVTEVGSRHYHSEETAMGRAIALAARMETAAEPGTVMVSQDTYRLVASQFEWMELGPLVVKGIQKPVQVYRPLAHRPQADRPRGLPGLASPLIGREQELLRLQDAIRRLQAGSGGIITLIGDAGLGKSRLVAELHQWVNRQINRPGGLSSSPPGTSSTGAPVFPSIAPDSYQPPGGELPTADALSPHLLWIEGRCVSYAGNSGYWLWADIVRNLFDLSMETLTNAALTDVSRRIKERFPDGSDEMVQGLIQLMSFQIEAYRKDNDSNWDSQVVPAELGPGSAYPTVSRAVEDEERDAAARKIPRAVIELLELASAQAPVLLVCEDLHWADATSLQLLIEAFALSSRLPITILGVSRPGESAWCDRALAHAPGYRHLDVTLSPLTVKESSILLQRLLRINELPDALQARVLEIGEGNPFYLEEILRGLMDTGAIVYDPMTQKWCGTEEVAAIAIPDTLQGILQTRIDRLPPDTKSVLQLASVIGRIFQYALLEYLVPDTEDLERHLEVLQAGTLIREQGSAPWPRADESRLLADGLAAVDSSQGMPWLTPRQSQTFIFKHHLTQQAVYLSLLERERRRLHREVAGAIKRVVAHNLWAYADTLAYHWERTDEASRAIPHLIRAGDGAQSRGADEEASRYFRRALALAGTANLKLAEAQAHAGLAFVARHQSDFELARSELEAAVAIYELFGNQRRVAPLLVELALIAHRSGAYAESERHCERVLGISRLVRNPRDEVHALVDLTRLYRQRGALVRARTSAESALQLSRTSRYPFGERLAQVEMGAVLCALGDYESSRRHLKAGLNAHEAQNDAYGVADSLVELSWVDAGLERFTEASGFAQRALDISESLHSRWRKSEASLALGWALQYAGQSAAAEAAYRNALALRIELRTAHLTVEPVAGLAQLLLCRSETTTALEHIEPLLERLIENPQLEGTRQPFAIYLTCYDVLTAVGDARAPDILGSARRLLRARVDQLRDPADRRRYLEGVPAHRRLMRSGTNNTILIKQGGS